MNKVLIGLMVGIGIGILIAPDKGTATRKKIREKLDDVLDKAGETFGDIVEQGRDAYDTGKEKISDILG